MNKRSCRQFCKKKTLKTEVRALQILIKNVHVFNINVLTIVFRLDIIFFWLVCYQ